MIDRQLLRRAWDALDSFKQAYPENWHEEDEQVLKDLMAADSAANGKPPEHIPESWATHGGLWIEALCKHQRGEK